MDRYKLVFVFLCFLSHCSCEISFEIKNKLVNGFIDFYNSRPNQIYTCEEGYLLNAQQSTELNSYIIEVTLKVSDPHDLDTAKYLKCTSKVVDLQDIGVSVLNHHCDETIAEKNAEVEEYTFTETFGDQTEAPFVKKPVQLDNEIQTNIAVTSGEQFVAIPREEQKVQCIGCSSHVNPQAPGVSDLAEIGVRQLNALEPNIKHTLNHVVDVERQVQVVNGVRYIITMVVDYNNCGDAESEICQNSKTCKVGFLEKPWIQLPDGSKHRAVLSNNCTAEWQFGDDGVVIAQIPTDSRETNNINSPQAGDGTDTLKPVHNVDVQAKPYTERTLTDNDIKMLEDQIITYKHVDKHTTISTPSDEEPGKQHIVKIDSVNQFSVNSIPITGSVKIESLSDDKKKAIDDMLSFFDFAGVDSTHHEKENTRYKRSYDKDLNMMNLVEKFQKVKINVDSAKQVSNLAQIVVDYLNEMDFEVKNRVLNEVLNAEEEYENHQHFYYIQFRVTIPCDKSECEVEDTVAKICNAVLDGTYKKVEILNTFCHDEPKAKSLGKASNVALDDPVLLEFIKEAKEKIESESIYKKAMTISRIIDASTQVVSGTVTKFSIVLDHTNCSNTVQQVFRSNCPVVDELGSQICDVTVHERHWLNVKKITFTCTERTVDTSFSNIRKTETKKGINDPAVLDMVNEALQYLEVQSNRNNKQMLVKVNSVATQLVAGFLTDIEFVVGYTTCTNDIQNDINKCKLLQDEPLRICKAKVWDRTWIEEGRQVDVSCKNTNIENEGHKKNKKTISSLGGLREQDPNDPKYRKLADESMQKYLENVGNTKPHKLLHIESVTTQVVAGTKTIIQFKISPLDQTTGDTISCKSEIWEQPWRKIKEIKVQCAIDNNSRKKRSETVGGKTIKDPNDPKYRKLADESMQKYLENVGNTKPHKLLQIESVTTQVVAGTITIIQFKISPLDQTTGDTISCKSEIWEQPWRKIKEIKVQCAIDNNSRKKRSETVGGKTIKDPNDPKYRKLADESMQKYLENVGNTKPHKLLQIESVTTQVVAGTITIIQFKISPLDQTTGDTISCKSDIWEQPWRKFKEIKVQCAIDNNSREKREVSHDNFTVRKLLSLDEENYEDINKPEYKTLAKESLNKFLQTSGGSQHYGLLSIERATVQLVSGTITRLEFSISPTNCQVDGDGKPSSTNCKVIDAGDVINCYSEILEQKWLDSKDINVTCHVENLFNKVKLVTPPGRSFDLDPSEPEYKELAIESLQKYMQINGITNPFKMNTIQKVTHQQLSVGTLIKIDFKISPVSQKNGDDKICHSQIWEKNLINKEISVNCSNAIQKRKKRAVFQSNPYRQSASNRPMGGLQKQDPTNIEYKALAQESLEKFLKRQKKSNLHSVVEVKKVSTRIVSGIMYNIEFVAAPAVCANDISTCTDESSILHCTTNVWRRPWLGNNEVNIDCSQKYSKRKTRALISEDIEDTVDKDQSRKKRQVGGEDYVDEDMSHYYAERAVQKLNERSGSENLYKLITVYGVERSLHMNQPLVRMYLDVAETYCVRRGGEGPSSECEELAGTAHPLCLARLYPEDDDDMIVRTVSVTCSFDPDFERVTGLSLANLLYASLTEIQKSPKIKNLILDQGEMHLVPSLDLTQPMVLSFMIATTNCSKDLKRYYREPNLVYCAVDISRPTKSCTSHVYVEPNTNAIRRVSAKCTTNISRRKRSVLQNPSNSTADDLIIQSMVQASLEKLEMASVQRYKQRVLQINSYSTKITSGKVTTIDFDVGFTSCLKFEWVDDIRTCEFLEHLPRRHCVTQVWERLWLDNGKNIDVTCEEEETPLEAHIEFESADMAMKLANESLKHIDAKYPRTRKQKVVRIFSLEKQVVAGIHYRMKLEVGPTTCVAMSADTDCKLDHAATNMFCRVNVWLRPWTDHPPSFRVVCDYQEAAASELYHQIQAEALFSDFITTYKPEYIKSAGELANRFKIFKANVKKIHELNTHEKGTATYGVTRFADLTYDEFSQKFLGLKPSLRDNNQVPMRKAEIPNLRIPDKFDWRDYGAVTEVKNQGSCGSCWAFSVTGNIEGQWKMQSGSLVSLSEQELVDCDKLDNGCNGGLPDNAYRAIEQLGGLELESDYPYEGEDDTCSFNKTKTRVPISGAVNITSNETDMAKWLVQNGPISIGINANAMQFYMGGVSHPWKMLCNPTNLDHGVLIVGYGIKDYPLFHKRLPYWTIKNSWGPGWGEQGYYRVYRGDGTCGVNQMASSSVI